MTLRETLHHDASPAEVYAMLTDPAFQARAVAATHALDHHVDVEPLDTDACRVVTRRALPTDRAPEAIRRTIGASVTVTQTTTWSPAAPDGSRTGRTDLRIDGAPVSGTGDIRLVPSGPGTDQIVTADITSSIPLVGGKIVKAVTPLVASALHAEHDAARTWLAQR